MKLVNQDYNEIRDTYLNDLNKPNDPEQEFSSQIKKVFYRNVTFLEMLVQKIHKKKLV